MINNTPKETIAVVGGGMTGIAAALGLARSGRFAVTLFEKQERIGGLSGYFQWQDVIWDRFYHVVLSTDTVMLEFVQELGLAPELFWCGTKSGFYGDGRLVSMSSPLDFLRFPFMTLWQKFRLGLGILYSARIKDPSKLDRIYVREWLTKVFGRRVYENIWDPLLRSKLGDARERTSAAFIWATINRLYGARSSDNKQEKMGHVHGGYKKILEAAEKKLREAGVTILTSHPVEKVILNKTGDPSLNIKNLKLKTPAASFAFDKALLTADCPAILQMVENRDSHPYWNQLEKVEYLGVICLKLILNRKLSPYYVINLLDRQLPFTGIIEATNIVPPNEVGGKHIVYLPKYLPASDALNRLSDDEIRNLFLAGLNKVYPDFADSDMLHCDVSRERYVQPLQELNYLERTSGFQTPVENLYMVNTSMIYNSTLNNNAAITLARKAAQFIIEKEDRQSLS
ncbi:MAG: NAD(P)/FAD-dependent oxidoreductase [Deltaproteobacteria bacterium]|nr:MAG: NAD(P)/FAD-dependent oxidoreductase [Deltaproteobacteria bacterium]